MLAPHSAARSTPGVTGLVPSHALACAMRSPPAWDGWSPGLQPDGPQDHANWRSVVASPPILDVLASDAVQKTPAKARGAFSTSTALNFFSDVAYIGV